MFLSVVALAAAAAKFEFLEEWEMWKEQHGKGYQSEREELERHLVWLSNKKYIDQHNVNTDIFGFTLAMNHFGDLVSLFNSPAPMEQEAAAVGQQTSHTEPERLCQVYLPSQQHSNYHTVGIHIQIKYLY